MLFFALIFLLCPSFVINDFFNVKFAPSTLTSVPYLNGEITVYQHVNETRYYLPPLAILQLNDTQVLYNRFTNRYSVRLALVLFTDELHQTVLSYLRKNLDRCHSNTECQIKMLPIDRLRIVWKRLQALSDNYELDSSWMSNTILLSSIYFNIGCSTYSACINLEGDIIKYPEIIDGLELEYSTPTEKHTRRDIIITGSNVMNTNMFASLKQMPVTTESNTRYLLADDMNSLISEVLTNVEMSDKTDAGYVSYDDQALMRDLLKNRIAVNQEILLGHKARQWESVYWNSDNIRPDLTVKLLNDQLSRQNTENTNEKQNEIKSDTRLLNETANADLSSSYNDTSKQSSLRNDTAASKYTNKEASKTILTDNQSSDLEDIASSSASSDTHLHGSASGTHSSSSVHSSRGGSSGFFGIGAREGSSSGHSQSNSNYQSGYDWTSNSRKEANRKLTDHKQHDINYESGSRKQTNAGSFQNFLQQSGSAANVRARNDATSDYKKLDEMDNFAKKNLDKDSHAKYEENRQYLEFHGNKFEVKPVTAYRVNLGQFHETLKLVSKSIIVQQITSIHAVPIRALNEPIILTPILEQYKVNMDKKLVDLKDTLLHAIHQTFLDYKQQSQLILDQTMFSTTNIISKALITDGKTNQTDTDLRYLIKKALTKTMTLHDVGLFDEGILNYYRHQAEPIEHITISSLEPLKIGLHFPNVYIEGMICDDQFDQTDAQLICRLFNNSTSRSLNLNRKIGITYDQKQPNCRFKTNYVNELVPCPFIMSSLTCPVTSKTLKDCSFQRPLKVASHTCQPNEHVNVSC